MWRLSLCTIRTAFDKNDERFKILGRIVPFVRDTKITFCVPCKCHYFPIILNHSSFLLKAIHCPDSKEWKPSHEMLLDNINPFLGYLWRKIIFKRPVHLIQNRHLGHAWIFWFLVLFSGHWSSHCHYLWWLEGFSIFEHSCLSSRIFS